MKVSEAGEFGLIKLLTAELGIEYPPRPGAVPPDGLLVGLGDDAVVTARRDGSLAWTTDTMVSGVHFLPGVTAWRDIGWKSEFAYSAGSKKTLSPPAIAGRTSSSCPTSPSRATWRGSEW